MRPKLVKAAPLPALALGALIFGLWKARTKPSSRPSSRPEMMDPEVVPSLDPDDALQALVASLRLRLLSSLPSVTQATIYLLDKTNKGSALRITVLGGNKAFAPPQPSALPLSGKLCVAQCAVLDSAVDSKGLAGYADWEAAAGSGVARTLSVPLCGVDRSDPVGSLHLGMHSGATRVDHVALLAVGQELARSKPLLRLLHGGQVDSAAPAALAAPAAAQGSPTPKALVRLPSLRRDASDFVDPVLISSPIDTGSGRCTPLAAMAVSISIMELGGGEGGHAGLASKESGGAPDFDGSEHEDVTVLVVNLSDMASRVVSAGASASDTLQRLEGLHSELDEICADLGSFKADVPGDAYVAIGNLSKSDADHARNMLRFAAAAQSLAERTVACGRPIDVRVGLSTGRLVGGVVRRRHVVVGPELLVASRLEQLGRPGHVHISEATLRAAKLRTNAPALIERLVRVPGVGLRRTYLFQAASLPAILAFSDSMDRPERGQGR